MDRQLIRFALVGASNTFVTVASFTLLITIGLYYPIAAVLGYLAGILNGYTWNRLWTFETGDFHLPEFGRYALVQGLGLGLNLILLAAFVEELHLAKGISEILCVVPIFLLTYSLNRSWTFHPRSGARPSTGVDNALGGHPRTQGGALPSEYGRQRGGAEDAPRESS